MPFFDDPFLGDREEKETTDTPPKAEKAPLPNEDTEEADCLPHETNGEIHAPEQDTRHVGALRTVFEYFEIVAITFCIVLFATLFVFRHAEVDGESMLNTLEDGEHLIISDLFYRPKAGDIIIFENNDSTDSVPLVKRVIAVGGQTVEIRPNGVWVDGVCLNEPYANTDPQGSISNYQKFMESHYHNTPSYVNDAGEVCYRWEVPEGHLFVMGDHRFASKDSRAFGPIAEESVLGRVLFRFSPLSKFGRVE